MPVAARFYDGGDSGSAYSLRSFMVWFGAAHFICFHFVVPCRSPGSTLLVAKNRRCEYEAVCLQLVLISEIVSALGNAAPQWHSGSGTLKMTTTFGRESVKFVWNLGRDGLEASPV